VSETREAKLELLKAVNLVKEFPGVTAVDGVSFSVERGEIFGFLGPNGAGKTTTINMLTGLARTSSGALFIDGSEYTGDLKRAQRIMGIVPDESNLYDELDGFQNLCFSAALYGMRKKEREQRARQLLRQFDLESAGKRTFKAYSRGMKRKLTIAAGIIHEPRVLFLDEPTTGTDVVSAAQIRRLILDLNSRGTTVFLTTHYIEEAERLCHRIAFIVNGKIVRIGTLDELMKEAQEQHVVQITTERCDSSLVQKMKERFPVYSVQRLGSHAVKVSSTGPVDLMPIMEFLDSNGTSVFEAKLMRPTLEEVFVRVTGIETEIMRIDREGKKK
jgi:ABC-2 type transport system ATP-binding protein